MAGESKGNPALFIRPLIQLITRATKWFQVFNCSVGLIMNEGENPSVSSLTEHRH